MSTMDKSKIYSSLLKYIISQGKIQAQFPEILQKLTKSQVMDIIEALCTTGSQFRWFSIMNSTWDKNNVVLDPSCTSIGFDWFFMNEIMFGDRGTFPNKKVPKHPITRLLKKYYDMYELDDWYKKYRLMWYQNLSARAETGGEKRINIPNFTMENRLIALLMDFLNVPIVSTIDGVNWTKCEHDIYMNGLIGWATGTGEIQEYGRKGENAGDINGNTRDLFNHNWYATSLSPKGIQYTRLLQLIEFVCDWQKNDSENFLNFLKKWIENCEFSENLKKINEKSKSKIKISEFSKKEVRNHPYVFTDDILRKIDDDYASLYSDIWKSCLREDYDNELVQLVVKDENSPYISFKLGSWISENLFADEEKLTEN